jgi:hypothetical protein
MSDNVSLLKYSLNLLQRKWPESSLKSICEYKIDKSNNKIEFCVFVFIQTRLPFSFEMSWFSLISSSICFFTFESIWFPVEWWVSVCEYLKRYIEWYIDILYWFIYLHPRLSWVRVEFDFNALASDSAPFEPIWLSVEWCVSVCEYIKRYIERYICYIILIYLLTFKIKFSESCVWFQCFSKWFCSFWTNLIPCWMMCQCVSEYIKRYIERYICYIILIYLLTPKIKLNESCVWFQCFSKWFCSFWINLIPCWMMWQYVWIDK